MPEMIDEGADLQGQADRVPELPADALLDLLSEPTALPENLDESTVPESFMVIVIGHAKAWLSQHRRVCQRTRNCPDTPGPLRILLRAHSDDLIQRSARRIHRELWRDAETTMTRDVREGLLKVYQQLADAVRDGTLFTASGLNEAIRPGDEESILELAAVLWAIGIEVKPRRRLFRLLPAFLPAEQDQEEEPVPAEAPAESSSSEKPRHKKKREVAEARAKELEEQLKDLRARGRRRAVMVTDLERHVERLENRLGDKTQAVEQLTEERDQVKKESREVGIALSEQERTARRVQQANDRLRAELAAAQETMGRLERDRRHLTRDLALIKTKLEAVETSARAIPRGADAVNAFLEEEKERINIDRSIAQGADRTRAEEAHAKHRRLNDAFRDAYPEYVPPRPEAVGEVRELHFTALGGGAEVGRSAYLVEIGSSRVLVDCGLAVGQTDPVQMVPAISGIGRLDGLVLTHAHTDHIGWVPALIQHQDQAMPIYCSEDTASIVPIMLDDARGHYERLLARRRRYASHNPEAPPVVEEYTEDDLYAVENRLRALRFDEPFDVPHTGLRLTIWPAGHILGAACVLLEGGGRRVFLSGDISSQPQQTVGAAAPPDDLPNIDLLVLESTYGDRVRPPYQEQRRALIDFVREATQRGTALLPCFALGRGQEVLQTLLAAKQAGDIDESVTIWVDGMIQKINPIYIEKHKLDASGFQTVEGPAERQLAIADCQRSDARAAVVTTSGMLSGGPIIGWADALLRDPRHRMALLGYQDEGSPGGALGRQLRRGSRPPFDLRLPQEDGSEAVLRIAGSIRDIGLSAHADQEGLVNFARSIPARTIALVHGDEAVQGELRNKLARELPEATVLRPASERITVA